VRTAPSLSEKGFAGCCDKACLGRRRGDVAEAGDDAQLMVGSARVAAQVKFIRVPPGKLDHFPQTMVRDALGAQ
jgi:hypothetical protein